MLDFFGYNPEAAPDPANPPNAFLVMVWAVYRRIESMFDNATPTVGSATVTSTSLTTDGRLGLDRRAELTMSRRGAFRMAREVAQLMVDTAGTQAIYTSSVLDRLIRDAVTMNQHIVAQDRMLEMVGGMALGNVPALPFI